MLRPDRLRIVTVGRPRRSWVKEAVDLYQQRLPGLEIIAVKESSPAREAAAILSLLKPPEKLVLFSEAGQLFNSRGLAQWLQSQASDRLLLAIGGADGHDPCLIQAAAALLSLSALTFPHEIALLLVVEQLYRSQTILQGGPYHRD